MAEELAYVIITPYSLFKSRTGGILSRLLSRTGLELAAARMFAPSAELIRAYADLVVSPDDPQPRIVQELIREYILTRMGPDPNTGRRRRVMMLILRGEDAVRKTRAVVGDFSLDRHGGQTIRDTYGDIVSDGSGNVRYFEPAVLAAPTAKEAEVKLKLWARYSDTDGGLLENVIAYQPGEVPERTLVLLKPDNFRFPTGRPGNMIDFFSRTGLYIVAIKVQRMSVSQAERFYAPVRETLCRNLRNVVEMRAKAVLERELSCPIPAEQTRQLGEILCPLVAASQFDNIVKFMSGRALSECPPELRDAPGTEKCIALVYEGVDAVRKIRDVLGPTDPSVAPPGSIRREFGQTILVNAAHASDSVESAQREMEIINIRENNFKQLVEEFYGGL
ncbi:MAG: nucleoside-diphosphate kinase [Verrucomicrobiae bacterium]|nr:nucleoside-diphosphate kinase [Verrucomicrobiae bacterium]MCX7721733.1 nucleoside-diphosphate kinase [Verrucomicrobiae bacterium]MDW7979874.1 nucleoside-diphosphate kinase [Verrucomicrobiales bacterium]